MAVQNEKFSISLKGNDVVDITLKIRGFIRNLNTDNCLLCVSASDPAVSIGLFKEEKINIALSVKRIVEDKISSLDDLMKYNPELYSEYSANFLGHSINLVVENKQLLIPDIQKIVLINFSQKQIMQDVVVSIIS